MTDAFVGKWKLDPTQNNYELGEPPQSGTYQIEPKDDGYLITMAWVTSDGQEMKMSYEGTPDGVEYAYENPAIADVMSMTRVDEHTLDSAAFKGGMRIAYARRQLSKDLKTMTVTQSGLKPDGVEFNNVSVYRRLD